MRTNGGVVPVNLKWCRIDLAPRPLKKRQQRLLAPQSLEVL
jgi:hypothetical protein